MLCFCTKSSKQNVYDPSSSPILLRKENQKTRQSAQGLITTTLYLSAKSVFRHNWESDNPQGWSAGMNTQGALHIKLIFSNFFSYSAFNISDGRVALRRINLLCRARQEVLLVTLPLPTRGKSFHTQVCNLTHCFQRWCLAETVGTEEALPCPCVQTQREQHRRDTVC